VGRAEQALAPGGVRIDAGAYYNHYDSDPQNNGAQGSPACNRGTDVDYWQNTVPGTDGCHIGWTMPGEFLEYQFQVSAAGYYDISAMLGSAFDSKKVRVEFFNFQLKGPAADRTLLAERKGWGVFSPAMIRRVWIPANQNVILRLTHLTGELDFNGFNVEPSVETTRVQAENFFTASDNTPENSGNSSACPSVLGVDEEITYDVESPGCDVGWGEAGEYLAYYVQPPKSGYYRVVARVASAVGGKFKLNGSGEKWVYTGGWQDWQDVTVYDSVFVNGPGPWRPSAWTFNITQSGVNLNYFELIPLQLCETYLCENL
jgi:hypothetical protein